MDYSKDSGIRRLLAGCARSSNGCWNWQGSQNPGAYGLVSFKGKLMLTHRLFYKLFNGPLYKGMVIRHLCGNRQCCNPAHIVQGTQKENSDDVNNPPIVPSLCEKLKKLELLLGKMG